MPRDYRRACRFAREGRSEEAERLYRKLEGRQDVDDRLRASARNDRAVLEMLSGRTDEAGELFRSALDLDPACQPARLNLDLLKADLPWQSDDKPLISSASANHNRARDWTAQGPDGQGHAPTEIGSRNDVAAKIALISFLFNWPSTGGGNIHTVELGQFLTKAGYEVRHFYARYPSWGIGRVEAPTAFSSEGLEFGESDWNVPAIQDRVRRAIDGFGPDCVLITDSWNMKPLLAEAVRGYAYFLRFQALECLCPLNNLRLLAEGPEQVEQCPRHRLATPDACIRCVEERNRHSGPLHQVERALAGVGTPEYDRTLRRALEEAVAVLVLNPLTEAILSPYARSVRFVPWGMDPERFPWPAPEESFGVYGDGVVTLFMAAVGGECIKGFHLLHEACRRLRQSRTDFELVVTFDPPGQIDEFTRSVGWVSQEDLPRHYRAADICVVPTIAQEGLSRTSVEAMASARPVIASRIGGLPFTVSDGANGLLFEPGNPDDLARKIVALLDDPPLRRRMGLAGRRRFERDFSWDVVIERYYAPLLKNIQRREANH